MARAREPARRELCGERRVAAHPAQRSGERLGRARVDQQRRVARGLGQRGRVRAHHRRAAGHRLERGQAEALVQARHRAGARRPDQRHQLLFGNAGETGGARAHAVAVERRFEIALPVRAAPHQHQAELGQGTQRGDERREVLARSEQADRDHVVAQALAQLRDRLGRRGVEARAVHAQVHRVYALAREAVLLAHLGGRELAVGDHVVGARHRVGDPAPAALAPVLAHPLGVPHRVQVVDGDQLRGRGRPRHVHAHGVEQLRAAQQERVERVGDPADVRVRRSGPERLALAPAREAGAERVLGLRVVREQRADQTADRASHAAEGRAARGRAHLEREVRHPQRRGRISPIGPRITASARSSISVGSAFTITICAPHCFAIGTTPAIG